MRRILEDSLGSYFAPSGDYVGSGSPNNNEAWDFIRETVTREQGCLTLANEGNAKKDCIRFIHGEENVNNWLDLVEWGMRAIDKGMRKYGDFDRKRMGVRQTPDDAIEELNFRFREAGVGYQYENGQVVRVDSQLVHAEVVRPALQLLSDPRFKGAEEEFLNAHAHYRAGEYKDSVTDALNAFESTLKAICDVKRWSYLKGARASDLIKTVRANGLLPDYLDGSFDQLIGTLQSGLPKVRNEAGAHGQGAVPRETPGYVAAYALHLAASKIVLLVEALRHSEGRSGA